MYPKFHNSFHQQSDSLLLVFWQLKDLCRRQCFSQHEVLCLGDCAIHVNALTCVSFICRETINYRCPSMKWVFLTYLKKGMFFNRLPCILAFIQVYLLINDAVCYEAAVLLKSFGTALIISRFHLQDFKKISSNLLTSTQGCCHSGINLKIFTVYRLCN